MAAQQGIDLVFQSAEDKRVRRTALLLDQRGFQLQNLCFLCRVRSRAPNWWQASLIRINIPRNWPLAEANGNAGAKVKHSFRSAPGKLLANFRRPHQEISALARLRANWKSRATARLLVRRSISRLSGKRELWRVDYVTDLIIHTFSLSRVESNAVLLLPRLKKNSRAIKGPIRCPKGY